MVPQWGMCIYQVYLFCPFSSIWFYLFGGQEIPADIDPKKSPEAMKISGTGKTAPCLSCLNVCESHPSE
jgi:hypothetical protein